MKLVYVCTLKRSISSQVHVVSLQGLRCEHGLAIMGQRLRRVVEGLVPALAGVSEEGAAAQAEVLTETEWEDLVRVRISFLLMLKHTFGVHFVVTCLEELTGALVNEQPNIRYIFFVCAEA